MWNIKRTHKCGELRAAHAGAKVALNGWVDTRRDHGLLVFINLRDRTGRVQVVFRQERSAKAHEVAQDFKPEYVVGVRGTVVARPAGSVNKEMPTGEIEVEAGEAEIINTANVPPFDLTGLVPASEELRMKYRYLDLRRPQMQRVFQVRNKVIQTLRRFFSDEGFIDFETPFLVRHTPGGARNFIVPSRVWPGQFYALAESPQLFKQLLMVAGMDKYVQIARCLRDEDLRADRQLEFTQLDVEMSFIDENDVIDVVERSTAAVFREVLGVELALPFPRLTFAESMRRFGCDKPDLRFGMELVDFTDVLRSCEFKVFRETIERGGVVKAVVAPGGAKLTRKEIDHLATHVQGIGGKGIVSFRIDENRQLVSSAAKHLSPQMLGAIAEKSAAQPGDVILAVADAEASASQCLSSLRQIVAGLLDLVDKSAWKFVWVMDFPLFEWSEAEKAVVARHHAFTSPKYEDLDFLETKPLEVHARAYDLVLNGIELGGGSIRIHRQDLQQRIFKVLGISEQEAREKFSFLLEALQFGAPPHGGIALGLDRFVMLLCGLDSIRDTIVFPKTTKAQCLMSGAPSAVDEKLLRELRLK